VTKATIIGAGFGGLAAALRLRARGYEVTVVDRLEQAGGRAGSYDRNGYIYDAGPTIVTAPHLFRELFELFDRDLDDYVELRSLDTWYRIRFHDGKTFDYGSCLDSTLSEIERYEPSDVDGYLKLLDKTAEIYRIGFEQLGDQPFDSVWSMLKVAPQLARLRSDRSVYAQTARYLKNPYLRQVFSFHPLLVGGNPFDTTSVYSLIHYLERAGGVHFAMGGTGALVQAFVDLLEEVGVSMRLGTSVDEILVKNGRTYGVRLDGGEELHSELVVANADAPFVYRHLIAPEHRRRWTNRRIEKLDYSMGLFVLYFGSNRIYDQLEHHEIHLGPRYKGLIDDIFDGRPLSKDFSFYLHAPTRTDPSLAPPDCESMYALVPVPNLKANIDWQVQGPVLRDRLLKRLDETVCPGIVSDVREDFYVTPEHFSSKLHSMNGAGFSIKPTLRQSAYFRFHNRSEDVDGLYFVGAGTHPGAGLPGVLMTAKVLDRLIPYADSSQSDGRATTSVPETASSPWEETAEATEAAMQTFRQRARSFSLAARAFPRPIRKDISTLYTFCRFIDDLGDGDLDLPIKRERLAQARKDLESGNPSGPQIADFLRLAARRGIEIESALELIEGVESDLGVVRVASFSELERYCYRVASTVGLMMCDLFGTRSDIARQRAIDLGAAMQMTNIARDLLEDFERDRIYLPSEWTNAATVARALSSKTPNEDWNELHGAVLELLDRADRLYESGENGIAYLPRRVRGGVLAAARIYRGIGNVIRERGAGGFRERAYVSNPKKIRIGMGAILAARLAPRFRSVSGIEDLPAAPRVGLQDQIGKSA
jgi:phytoene desaturase